MLVTGQDAVMKKWCPMIRLRWEARPFAYNRSNPGRSARFRNMLYRMLFPRLHHETRGHFFRCQGSGCMMWRWETKEPPASEPRKGILWHGRRTLHVHSVAEISTLFGQARGEPHRSPLPRPNNRADHAIQLGKNFQARP